MMIDGNYISDIEAKAVMDQLAAENANLTCQLRTYYTATSDALAAIFDKDSQAAVTFLQDALKTPRTFVTPKEAEVIPMFLQRQAD